MNWIQNYNPLSNLLLSSLVAALPVAILLGLLAIWHVRAHIAALIGLGSAMLVATAVYGMPTKLALAPDFADRVLAAVRAAHPYEEVAYGILRTENPIPGIGAGLLGPPALAFLIPLSGLFHSVVFRTGTGAVSCSGSPSAAGAP